ncbi:MAG TPA: response regulator [Dongiaceae bacterium]|nr:response regulator [Dongiaceae bacterium]
MSKALGGFENLRVLIVDDERSVVKILRMMLANIGVTQIFTAKDGVEALEFLGACDEMVNTVICDWNMPRMSGIKLLEQVRTTDPDMAFVMVTGRATLEAVYDAKSLNVTAFVAKPFSQDEIKKKLELVARRVSDQESEVRDQISDERRSGA